MSRVYYENQLKTIIFSTTAHKKIGASEKTHALKKGFYVIEPSGDTFNITTPTGTYYPHEW